MKNLFILPFLLSFQFAFAQNETMHFSKINEVFGEHFAENLNKSNPGKLALLQKYAETGFFVLQGDLKIKNIERIQEIPLREKGKVISPNEFVQIIENNTYNPLVFAWLPGIEPQVYQLAETGYFICIPSQKQLDRI